MSGAMTIARGDTVIFHYRLYLADGAEVAEADGAFARAAAPTSAAAKTEAGGAKALTSAITHERAERIHRIVSERGIAVEGHVREVACLY